MRDLVFMIFRVVFQLMHRLTPSEALVLVVVVVAVLVSWGTVAGSAGLVVCRAEQSV